MNISQWIDRHYKPTRLNSEPGRRERIIADRERDVIQYGYALISHHDCVMGETVVFPEGEAKRSAASKSAETRVEQFRFLVGRQRQRLPSRRK